MDLKKHFEATVERAGRALKEGRGWIKKVNPEDLEDEIGLYYAAEAVKSLGIAKTSYLMARVLYRAAGGEE